MIEALAGFVVTFLTRFLLGLVAEKQAAVAQQDLGRVTAERDQARAGLAVREAQLDAAINAPRDVDAAIARLQRGDA